MNSELKVARLFPVPLGMVDLSEELDKKEVRTLVEFASDINNVKLNQNRNLNTIDSYILRNQKLPTSKLNETLNKYLNAFAYNVMGYEDIAKFYITQSWLNVNPKGTSHHRHLHPNSIISGVLYLQSDDRCGNIIFHKEEYSARNSTIKLCKKKDENGINEANNEWISINPAQYTLILFPSTLEHSVNVSDSLQNRISLSFNTFVKGKITAQDRDHDSLTELLLD